jgi:PAS domain S-box-containing protein
VRYVAAVVMPLAALVLSLWGAAALDRSAALFYAAVLFSAWYGGFRPALLAAVLAAVGQAIVALFPIGSAGELSAGDYLQAVVLLLLGAVAGRLSESEWSAHRKAAEASKVAISAAGALELEKRRTETVFQSVSDGIIVQDGPGRVVFANDAAAQLLGHPAGDALLGLSPEELHRQLGPRDEDERALAIAEMPGVRARTTGGAAEQLISFTQRGSGLQRWALVTARAIQDEAGEVVLSVSALHELTDRIRHERVLEANARDLHQLTARLEMMVEQLGIERESAVVARGEAEAALERVLTLQRVTAALSEARTPDAVAQAVLGHGMSALGATSGVLLGFGGKADALELIRSEGIPAELVEQWMRACPEELARLKGALLREASEADEARTQPSEGTLIASEAFRRVLGTDALVMVPLSARDRALGLLVFDVHDRPAVESDDRDLLTALGRQCAQALDRTQLFVAERSARDEAEQASRAKSQFLAVMSHELRTPLNAILGYEELLETEISGPVSSIQKQHLARIRESTKHLLHLIEQILSLSRVQGGRDDVRIEEVDATVLANDVARAVEPQLQRKGVTLDLDLPSEPVMLRTDARKARQILFNVLSNAAKFTEQGAVRVSLYPADGAVFFTVNDTGRGIGDQDREHIFEPFVQLRSDGSMPSGTGLGLPVARELARHLGGDITVESRLGEGSAFTIRLPHGRLAEADADTALAQTLRVTTSVER